MTPANRLVDDVRRFGLMSAVTVAERYTGMLMEVAAGDYADGSARLGQAYLSLLDQLRRVPASSVERVALPPARAGAVSSADVWVHNPTNRPMPAAEVAVSPFAGVAGAIPADAVEAPGATTELEPGTSWPIPVSVRVPPGQAAGDYHALITVASAPDAPLALHLRVEA